MEKVLIMSVKAGYGHHSTGQAIKDYFNKNNIECEMLDVFGYISSFLGESINDGYMMLTKYLPEIYGGVYGKLAKNTKEKDLNMGEACQAWKEGACIAVCLHESRDFKQARQWADVLTCYALSARYSLTV